MHYQYSIRGGNGVDHNKVNNCTIRTSSKIATIVSQKQGGELCDIYRWGTSLSPTYLNNMNEFELHIRRWVEMWGRMGKLFLLLGNKEIAGEAEIEMRNTLKNLAKREYWEEVKRKNKNNDAGKI